MGTELRSLSVEGIIQIRGEEEKMLIARRKQKLKGMKGRERGQWTSATGGVAGGKVSRGLGFLKG